MADEITVFEASDRDIDLGDGLKMRAGVVRLGERLATADDVPLRDDLPDDHPLLGQRALRVVPSGYGDCTLDAEGRLVPVSAPPQTPKPKRIDESG